MAHEWEAAIMEWNALSRSFMHVRLESFDPSGFLRVWYKVILTQEYSPTGEDLLM